MLDGPPASRYAGSEVERVQLSKKKPEIKKKGGAVMAEYSPDVAGGELPVGCGARMLGAVWFAATALIPIVFFLVIFGHGIWSRSSYSDEGTAISFYVLLPICMAAFFGFTIGS